MSQIEFFYHFVTRVLCVNLVNQSPQIFFNLFVIIGLIAESFLNQSPVRIYTCDDKRIVPALGISLKDHRLCDFREQRKLVFQFFREYVLSVFGNYNVFLSACYYNISLIVYISEIACMEPAVSDNLGSCLRISVISQHDIVALRHISPIPFGAGSAILASKPGSAMPHE